MRQLIGTSAEWLANDVVLGDGELGVEIVDDYHARIKVGDGVTAFSNCPVVKEAEVVLHDSTDYDNHISYIRAMSGFGFPGMQLLATGDQLTGGWVRVAENYVRLGVQSNTYRLAVTPDTVTVLDLGSFHNNVLWTPREINKVSNFTFIGADIHNNTIIINDGLTGTLDTTLGPDASRINIFTQDATGFQLVSGGGAQVIEWQKGGTSEQRTAPTPFNIAPYSVVHLQKSSTNFWFMWGIGIS